MKLRIRSKGIGNFLLLVLLLLLIIHLLVLFGVLSPALIWNTTVSDPASLAITEYIAIFFILLFGFGICLKLNYFPLRRMQKSADTLLWIMVLYYALNIIGSFMSDSGIEKVLYAPLTFMMILLIIRLIFSKNPKQKNEKRRKKTL